MSFNHDVSAICPTMLTILMYPYIVLVYNLYIVVNLLTFFYETKLAILCFKLKMFLLDLKFLKPISIKD